MHKPFGVHPCAKPEPVHQVCRHAFENAGPDPPQHMVRRGALHDHAVYSSGPKEMAEQEPRWPSADDGNLRLHCSCCSSWWSTR